MPPSQDAKIVRVGKSGGWKSRWRDFSSATISIFPIDCLTDGPKDWRGRSPLASGYYVLGTWTPKRDFAGTVLIVAQDMFFAPESSDDVKNVVAGFRQAMSAVDGMSIDREPEPVSVGGYAGYRIDFSGVGLFRSMFAIEIRCHVVTFNLTSRDPNCWRVWPVHWTISIWFGKERCPILRRNALGTTPPRMSCDGWSPRASVRRPYRFQCA